MPDRAAGPRVTWRQGQLWHRVRFEPRSDGGFDRIEEIKHSSGDTWRPRGSERVDSVDIDAPGVSYRGP